MAKEPELGIHAMAFGIHSFGKGAKYAIRDGRGGSTRIAGGRGHGDPEKHVGPTDGTHLRDPSEALIAVTGPDITGSHSPIWISRFTIDQAGPGLPRQRVLSPGRPHVHDPDGGQGLNPPPRPPPPTRAEPSRPVCRNARGIWDGSWPGGSKGKSRKASGYLHARATGRWPAWSKHDGPPSPLPPPRRTYGGPARHHMPAHRLASPQTIRRDRCPDLNIHYGLREGNKMLGTAHARSSTQHRHARCGVVTRLQRCPAECLLNPYR